MTTLLAVLLIVLAGYFFVKYFIPYKVDESTLFKNAFESELNRITDKAFIKTDRNGYTLNIINEGKNINFSLCAYYGYYGKLENCHLSIDAYYVKIRKRTFRKLEKLCEEKIKEIERVAALRKIGIKVDVWTGDKDKDKSLKERLDPSIAEMFFNNLEEFKSTLKKEQK